jgi:hypothetical protein
LAGCLFEYKTSWLSCFQLAKVEKLPKSIFQSADLPAGEVNNQSIKSFLLCCSIFLYIEGRFSHKKVFEIIPLKIID